MDNIDPHIALWLASLWGALTYAALGERNATVRGWVVCAMVGTGSGVFFAPVLCEWRGVTHPLGWPFFGFLFGVFGVLICRAGIDSARSDAGQMIQQSVVNFVRRVTGNGPPPPSTHVEPDSDPGS